MHKFWRVAAHEYLRHAGRKRFIFALLSMPFFIALMVGISLISVVTQSNSQPVGLVDTPKLFSDLVQPPQTKPSLIKPSLVILYSSESDAKTALDKGSIQAYAVLDVNYLQNGQATLYSIKQSGSNVSSDLGAALRYNLLLSQPPEIINRLNEGNDLVIKSADGSRQMSENNILGFLIPSFSGVLFMIAIGVSGGYLQQAMVEEKENRTMEIVITSVSPKELMAAKIIGNLAIGLTQIIVWIMFGVIAILFLKNSVPAAQNMQVDISSLLIMAGTFIPSLVMVGALMAMTGAVVTDAREAQQVSGLFTLPIMLPYFFISSLMLNPNGPLATGLSLFPLTAPISLPMRASFTIVPAWQVILAISLLVLCAAAAIWLASRAFQVGMLRYGKRLSFGEILRGSSNGNRQASK